MLDEISLIETDQLEAKIQVILRQTNYTTEEAREKLNKFNFNEEEVIRDYFGITEKKNPEKITSLNQGIYKQLRGYLDSAMKNYREKNNK
jgi:hypothetical protein